MSVICILYMYNTMYISNVTEIIEIFEQTDHTWKKLGKNNFFYLVKKVHFSGIENFISQRCENDCNKWKVN
jgi:hypothetical protein